MRLTRMFAAVLFILSLSTPAVAQQIQKSFATQLFSPAFGIDGFFGVSGPWVNDHLAFDIDLYMNYQHKPLVLYTITKKGAVTGGFDIEDATAIDVVESQMTANLMGSMGFHYSWLHSQVGLDLPINLLLTGNEVDAKGQEDGELSATGIGDLRLEIKVQLLRDWQGLSVAFAPIVTFPTGNDDGFGGGPNLSFTPKVTAGFRPRALPEFFVAAELGYLVVEDSLYFSSDMSDRLLYGVAAGYQVSKRFTLMAELFGRAGFSTKSGCSYDTNQGKTVCDGTSGTDLDAYPLELDLGTKVSLWHGLSAGVGIGFGLIKAVGSPQFRIIAGLQWAPDFKDSDHDGIYDYKDKCPTQAEDKDGFQDADGCPELDNDEDLIPDARDKCPNEPEDKDTFQDDDGCPELDNDSDGIPDIKDSCPFKPETKNGFKDEDGCPDVPDQDGDGIEDAKDKCPKQEEDKDKFEDLDGCPDPDNDNDGVPDKFDDCPLKAEDMDGFKDDDGCPDLDNDNDGVLDKDDKCPLKPETINGIKDKDGCPDKGQAQVVITANKIQILKKVFFATGRSKIKRRSYSILNQVALVLSANKQVKGVRIEGHTDSRGNARKNKTLSQKRAEAVRDYMINKGVEPGRLFAAGFGPDKPIEDNKTRRGRAANRRVEFVILEQAPGMAK
jgi:outer membrane protein OmpA-like peptidoglycan-associated protein